MNQAHDITFWLAFLMIVCPVMDGIAAPVIQINRSGIVSHSGIKIIGQEH